MKNLLSLALAGLSLAVTSQPMYAERDKEEGRGRGRGAAARAQVSAPQMSRSAAVAPQRSMQMVQPRQKAAVQQRATVQGSNVQRNIGARTYSGATGTRAITRSSPSVAFGGQTRIARDSDRVVTSDRRFESGRTYSRNDFRYYRPPLGVYRDWNRDRIYTWNNHRWHWSDGVWVVFDTDNYGGYYEPSTTAYAYSDSGSLAAQVQRRLANEGYDPGPIDGVIGGQTRGAIAAFQRDHDLAVTGEINGPLLRELDLR